MLAAAGQPACRCTYLGDSATDAGSGAAVHVDTADWLPEMAAKWAALQAAVAPYGITLQVASFGGFRTAADTALILGYRQAEYPGYVAQLARSAPGQAPLPITSWRPIAPYGTSYHDFGGAVDAQPIVWPSSMTLANARAVVQQVAPAVGLRVPLPTTDPQHLELPYPLATVQTMYALQLANASSQPDVSAVSLPSEVAAGNIPGVSLIPGQDLQQLLTPITAPPPDVGLPPGPGNPVSTAVVVAVGVGVLGVVFFLGRSMLRGA